MEIGKDYQVKVNARAKRMRIKISPLGSVEVVTPKRITSFEIESFVESNINWIKKTQSKLSQLRETTPELNFDPPDVVTLVAVEKCFSIYYDNSTQKPSIVEDGQTLRVSAISDESRREVLKFWLQRKAENLLIPWITAVARQHSLQFNKVTVRAQKTRWGSCSAKKNININRNLLFVAPELVHYLFAHELSHLVHLNHSPAFWQQVALLEPNFQLLDRALNRATRDVPLWAISD